MKEICRKLVDGDHNPPKGENKPTKFLMASSKNINNDSLVNLEDVRFLSEVVFKECDKRTKVSVGDIAITSVGTLGRSCIIENDYNLTFQRSVTVITLIIIHNYYVKYYLDSAFIQNFMYENAKGTAQQGFYINQMEELLIPLPPLAEQQRIVAEIERWFVVIDALESNEGDLLKTIDQTKKKILDLAIRGKLVPQDPNDEPASELLKRLDITCDNRPYENVPFEVPNGWCMSKLSDLCMFLSRGKSPKYSETDSGYPVYAQKCNLKDGGISIKQARFLDPSTLEKWPEKFRLKTGDVLVNSTGTGTVGRTRLFDENCLGKYPFVLPDSHVSIVRTYPEISSEFVFYVLYSEYGQNYFNDNLAGSTNQKELYIGVLGDMSIYLPPLAEQKRIVDKVEELFSQLDTIAKALE